MTLGAAGALGFGAKDHLSNPHEMYPEAHKQAVKLAAERGVAADQVQFVGASASMPLRDGKHWRYSFSIPAKNGGISLIYADASSLLGGAPEIRTIDL